MELEIKQMELKIKQLNQDHKIEDRAESIAKIIDWCMNNQTSHLVAKKLETLCTLNTELFVKKYDEVSPILKFRKNSTVAKLYEKVKSGIGFEIKREVFFEDANLTAYTEGDRAYIHFVTRPQRQLIVALKSRKYWWNRRKNAWSTCLSLLDKEWVSEISTQYAKYV